MGNARLATTAWHPKFQNARFATAACAKMYESSARRPRQPAPYKNHHFTTVSDVWPARSDERVAPSKSKFAFHHSFGRPTNTKWRKGCATTQRILHFTTVLDVQPARSDERVARDMCKIRISPQFWTSDEHEVTRGLRDMCKIRISPQFWASDEHEVTRGLRGTCAKFAFHHSIGRPTTRKWREGCLPPVSTNPTRRKKKKKFLRSLDPQPFSAALVSTIILSNSQQLFSAQSFSAILSSSSQHSAILSSHSSHSQQPFSAKSSCCGQRLVVS